MQGWNDIAAEKCRDVMIAAMKYRDVMILM